jgi:hypothetical protein
MQDLIHFIVLEGLIYASPKNLDKVGYLADSGTHLNYILGWIEQS